MNKLVKQWIDVQAQLASLKRMELKLRKSVLEKYPGELGTSTVMVDKDTELKITRGVTTNIDNEALSMIYADLLPEEKECITYKPSLNKKLYDKLDRGNSLISVVTLKPALPSIKVNYIGD